MEPHIAMVHEGVRKKCEICNKVLSDLNKHMRTVHGTYRRKAKIPKELIGEMDNPRVNLMPQIYGTNQSETEQSPASQTDKQSILETKLKANNIPKTKTHIPEVKNSQDDMQSIKKELGLSSGITLQKIIRPIKGPPKLTYHGPGTFAKSTKFGSITITPKTPDPDTNNCHMSRLVKMPEETESSIIKISGNFSRKLPDLVPLKKIVQKS